MPMCNITGYLYNSAGAQITTGVLTFQLQQDMVYNGQKVVPFTVTVDLSATSGYVNVTLYPTATSTPAGIAYKLEFDPEPLETTKPLKQKAGYFRNFLNVPNQASESLGNIVSALRGQPAINYMPIGGSTPTLSDTVSLGTGSSGNKRILANNADVAKPEIRYNDTSNAWEFSNDGSSFQSMLQGGGGSVGGDLSGTVGTASVIKIRGSAVSVTAPSATGQFLRWNTSTSQYEPSLDASLLTGISASSLGSGTVPLARLSGITNAQIDAAAAIAWTKISMVGSSLANLATRSASDINSGTLAVARMGTGTPSSSTYLRGDGSWATITSSGDVVGPAGATTGRVATFDGTTGKLIADGGKTIAQIQTDAVAALNASNLTSGTVPLARLVGITNTEIDAAAAIAWSKLNKGGSSLADLTTRSASDLSSGTLPLARLTDIADAQIAAAAAIAWTKISKTGSSLADLVTRSAADLTSGTLPLARLTDIADAQIAAAAAIGWAKISKTGSSLADLTTRSAGDLSSGTVATARLGSGTANSTTFLRGDQTWAVVGAGAGDVVGPASSVVSEIALFDGTTGKLIKAATGTGVVKATAGVYSAGTVSLASEVSGDLPFANIAQASAASKLVGRGAASGAGDFEEITLGTNLSMSGTTLNVTGAGSGDVVGPASSVVSEIALFDGTTGKLIKAATGTGVVKATAGVYSTGTVSLTTEVSGDLPFSSLVQASAISKLVGRGAAAGAGDFQEITLGTNLSMSGTTLNVTGGTGDVVGPASSIANELVLFDGTTGKLVKAATGTGVVKATAGVYSTSNVNLASEVTGNLPSANLGTTGTPQFARVGIGAAADADDALKMVGQYGSRTFDAGNSSTAITVNWNNGNTQLVTMTGNATFTLSNPKDGYRYLIFLKQDATGSRVPTLPSSVKWPAGTTPTWSTAAGKVDVVSLVWMSGLGASGNYIAAANADYTPA